MGIKKVLYLLLAVILVSGIILSGCAKATPSTTPPATSAPPITSAPPATKPPASAPPTAAPTAAPTTAPATTAPTAAPQKGGILTIISPNAPTNIGYPAQSGALYTLNFNIPPCVESLIDSDINGNIYGELATSWEVAKDLSSITYKLRQGVKFHDGSDFNADVAKFNLDMYLKRGTGSPAFWKSVDVVDPYTVRINLKLFSNTQLAQNYFMVSKVSFEKNGADWAITHPVGTGPFMFKSFIRDNLLEYTRFDGYWGDKPLIDGIKYLFIVDPTTAGMAFKGGDAQVWESADPKTAYDLVNKLGFKRETRRGPIMDFLPDSVHQDSPFSNLKVRLAMDYAIDRQKIADTFGFGTWEATPLPCVPEQFGYIKGIAYPYDPAKAKQLLTEAGYPNGFSTKIITSTQFPQDQLVAVQSYLGAVGVKVTFDVQSPAAWSSTARAGWSNGLFYTTHGATDFNYCAYLERYHSRNALYSNPVSAFPDGWFDAVDKMLANPDPAQYKPMAQALVKQFNDFAMDFPLWVQSEVYVMDPWVMDMGVGTHGDGFSWNYNKVWLAKH